MTLGDDDLPAAIFVYKRDESVEAAWKSEREIRQQEGAVRGACI